ncbi:adenylate kinase [Bacteroidia bacterium]|nr:adenylate kinase [Bacteroidia bacterium]
MLNIVIFGAPGSGKGTQSELIISKYRLHHISTGEILRVEMETQTELGKMADAYIKEGQLIPDDLIIRILSDVLALHPDAKGFVFDGFPRTIAQGEALDIMLREKDTSIMAVFNLNVEEKEVVDRLLNRGKKQGRSDDSPEIIQNRLTVYHTQTEPLIEYYRKKGKLFKIKGGDSIDDVFEQITQVLDRLSY